MSDDDGVESEVVALIHLEGLQDAFAELAEAGLDQLISDGFLRDVPVLGSVIGALRAAGGVRDLLLAKKLGRFFRGIQETSSAERKAFVDSLIDVGERRRIGERLILLIDRLDDMDKPELVATIFRAFMQGRISLDDFRLMARAIDRLHMAHLPALISFYVDPSFRIADPRLDTFQDLSQAGLVRIVVSDNGAGIVGAEFLKASADYERNSIGAAFVEILTAKRR